MLSETKLYIYLYIYIKLYYFPYILYIWDTLAYRIRQNSNKIARAAGCSLLSSSCVKIVRIFTKYRMKSEARGRSDLIILKSARALMNKRIFRNIYSRDYAVYASLIRGITALRESSCIHSTDALHPVKVVPIQYVNRWKQPSAKCADLCALKLFALVKWKITSS